MLPSGDEANDEVLSALTGTRLAMRPSAIETVTISSGARRVRTATLPSPAILFSSPTLNGTLVPLKQYQVPAETNSVPQTPPPREPAQPGQVTSTGVGGDRPEPTYPKMAEELGQQGSVVLLLTADEAGLIISAEVKESSGSSILDRAAADFIKRHWTVPPGARGRLFQARIDYKLH